MANKNNVTILPSKTAANRSVVPIPSTIESIKGYPEKLIIFQVPASPYWWVRYYDGRPIKRSTKTTGKRLAIKFAKEFYETLLVNKKLGKSNNPRQSSFAQCVEGLLQEDQQRAANGELSASYVKNHKAVLGGHITDFFGGHEVSDIDYAVLDKFKAHLVGQNLAASSIKVHLVYVKKVLAYAQRHKLISAVPQLPKVKNEDSARGYFEVLEYRKLRRTARQMIGSQHEVRKVLRDEAGQSLGATKKLRNIFITEEIALLIPFMIYTFIRPTDLKNLKHRHIEIRQGAHGKDYLFMPLPTSKKHSKPITSMPRAATFYKRLRDLRLAERADQDISIADDYVFMPDQANRDYALKQLARQFGVLLNAANLKLSVDGDARTLYSLRHTSLMYRLRYGGNINPLILANNARTSVEMLERFYLAQLESSQVTSDLHARKPIIRRRRAAAINKPQQTIIVSLPEKVSAQEPPIPSGSRISSADAEIGLDLSGLAAGILPDR